MCDIAASRASSMMEGCDRCSRIQSCDYDMYCGGARGARLLISERSSDVCEDEAYVMVDSLLLQSTHGTLHPELMESPS